MKTFGYYMAAAIVAIVAVAVAFLFPWG